MSDASDKTTDPTERQESILEKAGADSAALDGPEGTIADDPRVGPEGTAPDELQQGRSEQGAPGQRPEAVEEAIENAGDSGDDATRDENLAAEAANEATEDGDAEEDTAAGGPDDQLVVATGGPIELFEPEVEEIKKDWFILKVQSNRERSIALALQRKVSIEGLDDYFGQIIVPTEKVTEFKGGKKKIVERKLWPGYIAVQMHVNDDTWFAIRETSGIGDFTGSAGTPTPMQPHEVALILHKDEEESSEAPKLNIKFNEGDKVKVKDGNFESFEGEVSTIDEQSGKITIMISIFGRSTPVELEYWQVESV